MTIKYFIFLVSAVIVSSGDLLLSRKELDHECP